MDQSAGWSISFVSEGAGAAGAALASSWTAGKRGNKNLYSQPQTPCGRVFFRHTALRFLAIHKVFLQKRVLSGEKIPRPPSIFGCEYRF
jgi:hypothetical protein